VEYLPESNVRVFHAECAVHDEVVEPEPVEAGKLLNLTGFFNPLVPVVVVEIVHHTALALHTS